VVDRLEGALGQHRAELEGEVRRAPHLLHGRGDEVRQALPAELRGAEDIAPAGAYVLVIGLLEAGRHGDGAILPPGAGPVADGVERREHLARELAGLLEDRVDHVVGELLPALELVHLVQADHVLEHELHVLQRCDVFGHGSPLRHPGRCNRSDGPGSSF
jgi:hypothetical protein